MQSIVRKSSAAKVFWKQSNGKLISVDDMDINHLRNVLKMIIRNSEKKVISKTTFKLYGDIANDINDMYDEDIECNANELDLY